MQPATIVEAFCPVDDIEQGLRKARNAIYRFF
jgi:hypothetical protein